jgi:SAM-dependent methyltransferase
VLLHTTSTTGGPPARTVGAVSFDVTADQYTRFMGRYSEPLAAGFADAAGVAAGQRALDVGCGAGALTAELVRRLGAAEVCAVDPQEAFVASVRQRCPGTDTRVAPAERLPFGESVFDVALAQLVVHFMADPVAGLREMARVTRPGGRVGACVWDHAGGGGPLTAFWRAVRDLDPTAPGESGLAGAREGHLTWLFGQAGLTGAETTTLTVVVRYATFGDWWEPFTLGVGPAGSYVTSRPDGDRAALRDRCQDLLGPGPFAISASAWTVTACR